MTPELHSLTQKYPPMEAEEFAAFRADLAAHGQKNPIWLFEGKVLDGRNRLRACLELGLDPVFAEFAGTEAEAVAFVDSQNLHRRHLSREWRQQRVREMRDHGMSYRAIAQELGTSAMTILRDASSGVTNVTPEHSAQDSGVTFVTPEQSASNSREFADPSEATPTHRHPSIPVGGPAPVNQSSVSPSATTESPRIRGRDGKSYRAERPAASKHQPAPKEKAQWSELASVLTELAQKVENLVPTPAENEKPWELISSLEATARSLLRQAERLKRRHHL
jgi:transposase-like protein